MAKRITYQTGNHFGWFLALSLALSIFAYTDYSYAAEACQSQPQHVECVFSSQNEGNIETISVDKFFAPEITHKPVKRQKEYEAHVQAVHQNQHKVAMRAVLERLLTYPSPIFYQQVTTILLSSDEISSDISG